MQIRNREIMQADYVIENMRNIPARIKFAFAMTYVIGFLTHGFIFANKVPNSDDLYGIRAYGGGYSLGRWMLSLLGDFISRFYGNYTNPWLTGMEGLFFLACAVSMVIVVFEIESLSGIIAIASAMVSFPSVMGLFVGGYIAPYYCFAILLGTISVYVVVSRGGVIFSGIGIVLIAATVGIYQAFYVWIASLLLMHLLAECLDERESFTDNIKNGLKYLTCLVLGILCYLGLNKFFLYVNHTELSNFKNLDKMGQINLRHLPEIVQNIYIRMWEITNSDYKGIFPSGIIQFVVLICYFITIVSVVNRLVFLYRYKQWGKIGGSVLCIVLFPIAINLIDIMCENSVIYLLMTYAMCCVFILPVVIWDKCRDVIWIGNIFSWGILLIGIVVAFYYFNLANANYLYVYLSDNAAEHYYSTLKAQINEIDGYTQEMPIAFVGEISDETIFRLKEEFPGIEITASQSMSERIMENRRGLLKYYLGYQPKYISENEVLEKYAGTIKEMPCYPDAGSVALIDGKVVVKFSE